jgi:hypothetical protein
MAHNPILALGFRRGRAGERNNGRKKSFYFLGEEEPLPWRGEGEEGELLPVRG